MDSARILTVSASANVSRGSGPEGVQSSAKFVPERKKLAYRIDVADFRGYYK